MDKLLEKHVVARFISLVLAFLLWLSVVNEQNPEIDRPLTAHPQLRGLPADMVLTEEVEPVSLRLRGRRNDILDIRADELEVYLNLAGVGEGENEVEVKLGRLPAGIKVVEIIPANILVRTEGIIQEQREIQLSLRGEPAEGHFLGKKHLSPTQVIVEGPRSIVEGISRVVARLDVAEAAADIQEVVLLQALSRQGNVLNENVIIRPEVVEIKIPVEELPSKVLEVKHHVTGEVAEGYQIDEIIVAPSVLRVYAPQEILDQVAQVETAPIDVAGATSDIIAEPRLLVPDGVQLPFGRVRVTVIVREKTRERKMTELPIRANNLREGLVADLEPGVIDVVVFGPANLVDSLEQRDVMAFVNTNNLEPGQHRLRVRLELPSGVQRVAVDPEEVSVIITEAPEG
ncbi:MAG: hypothetical protein GX349_04805 [Firmicutes bacterium]|nr:hypothetical protein [Bacillota bacterium]